MRSSVLLVCMLCAAGCRADLPGGSAAVTDSAGVRVVENDGARWRQGRGWSIDNVPAVTLQSGGGAPVLSQVQGASRLSDGRIAVIEGSTQELRIHDRTGRFVSAAGSRGTGPGQSRNLGSLSRMRGDSLFAWDYTLGRGLVYDAHGKFVRHVSPLLNSSTYEQPRLARPLPDGRYIGAAAVPSSQIMALGSNGFWEAYLLFDGSGVLVDTIGEQHMARCAGTQLDCSAGPFGPVGLVALSDDRLYYGFTETYDIRAYDLDGTLREVIRRRVEPVHVPTAFFDTLRAQWSAALRPDQQAGLDRFMKEGDFGTIMPLFRSLVTDTEGNLWVGEVNEPFQMHLVFRSDIARMHGPSNPAYSVFDRKGVLLGSVHVPPGLVVYEIGDDYILGELRDGAGNDAVRLYRLGK